MAIPYAKFVLVGDDNVDARTLLVNRKKIEVAFWDTAGQSEYDRLRPISYSGANVFFLLFSVVSPTSFENIIGKYYPEIAHHGPNVPIILVGTKIDLRNDTTIIESLRGQHMEPITYAQGTKRAEEIGAVMYVEIVATTQEGLKQLTDIGTNIISKKIKDNKKQNGSCYLL